MKWLNKHRYRILRTYYSNNEIKYVIQCRCCGLFWLKMHYGEFLPSVYNDDRYNYSWGDNNYICEFDNLDDAKLALKWLLKSKQCLLGVNLSKEIVYLIEKRDKDISLNKFYGSTDYIKAENIFNSLESSKLEEPIKIIKKDKIYL